jgi:hypothetical protein
MRNGKPKKVTYELIPRDDLIGAPIYGLLESLIVEHHDELRHARVAIAWCTSWKADVDGRLTLGKCRKASDLDRELSAFDFVILLNRDFWQSTIVGSDQRIALLDHELCHARVALDEQGEPKEDERGRIVYRIRKHDIEEFTEIVERRGVYKRDLEVFARALRRGEQSYGGVFVGFSTLQEQLVSAGAVVPLDVIVTWTEKQRSDAAVWAFVQRESPLMAPAMPAFITEAITAKVESIEAAQPIQDTLPPMPPQGFPEPTEVSR